MTSEDLDELLSGASFAALQGHLEDALDAYAEAETIARDALDRARVADGKAGVLIRQERFEEAKTMLHYAIEQFGGEVPATSWGNLGCVLDHLKQFGEAAAAHTKCITALEAELGEEHPRVFKKLGDLAFSLWGLGDLDDAEEALRDAVSGFQQQPNREPLWYARACSNLGYFMLHGRRNAKAAMECFERAEALRDACTFRLKSGQVLREGFPGDFEVTLLANRAAAAEALGNEEEAAHLRARVEALTERTRK